MRTFKPGTKKTLFSIGPGTPPVIFRPGKFRPSPSTRRAVIEAGLEAQAEGEKREVKEIARLSQAGIGKKVVK